MALGDYEKTTYVNGSAPGLSAQNLNKNENKTEELDNALATHLADYASHLSIMTTQGDLITRDATGAKRLPKGTPDQLLKMKTDGTEPEWSTVNFSDGAWEKIADITLASTVQSIEFASLGLENFRFLKLMFSMRSNDIDWKYIQMKFNDSVTNYHDGSSPTTIITLTANLPYDTPALSFGLGEILITNLPNLYKTIFKKYIDSNTATTVQQGSHGWDNVSDITKITLSTNANSFQIGSKVVLWGVK